MHARPSRCRPLPRLAPSLALLLALGSLLPIALARAEEVPRQVTVTGQGEVRVEPDQAKLTLGIEAREPTLAAARLRANRTVDAVLKLTRELGIPDRQVNSTRLAVMPEYSWEEKTRQRRLVAYQVTRTVSIDLRELDQLGVLLERGMSLGANQTGDPVLDHSRRTELEREALALATREAARNAAAMAGALGMTVGPARSLNASQDSSGPVPMAMAERRTVMLSGTAVDSPQSYRSGEIVFRASVSAAFDLLPGTPTK